MLLLSLIAVTAGRTGPLRFCVAMVGPGPQEARNLVEQVVGQVQGMLPEGLELVATIARYEAGMNVRALVDPRGHRLEATGRARRQLPARARQGVVDEARPCPRRPSSASARADPRCAARRGALRAHAVAPSIGAGRLTRSWRGSGPGGARADDRGGRRSASRSSRSLCTSGAGRAPSRSR